MGFFVDEDEALDGIAGISAPIRDYTVEVIAGIGVGFISSSENAKRTKRIIKEVCETAREISKEMGCLERRGSKRPPKNRRILKGFQKQRDK